MKLKGAQDRVECFPIIHALQINICCIYYNIGCLGYSSWPPECLLLKRRSILMVYSLTCAVAKCSCFPSCVAAAVRQQQQQQHCTVGHTSYHPPILAFSTQTNFIGSWYCWSSQGPPTTPAASHFFQSITWFISASLSPDVLVKLGNCFCFLSFKNLIRIWCCEMEQRQKKNGKCTYLKYTFKLYGMLYCSSSKTFRQRTHIHTQTHMRTRRI